MTALRVSDGFILLTRCWKTSHRCSDPYPASSSSSNFIVALASFAASFSTLEKERRYSASISHRLLQIEQERLEKLLPNILPGSIAETPSESSQTIADGFADDKDVCRYRQLTRVAAEGLTPQQVSRDAQPHPELVLSDEPARKIRHGEDPRPSVTTYGRWRPLQRVRIHTAAIADMATDSARPPAPRLQMSTRCIPEGPASGSASDGRGRGRRRRNSSIDLWGDTLSISPAASPARRSLDDPGRRDDLSPPAGSLYSFHDPQTIYLKGKGSMVRCTA